MTDEEILLVCKALMNATIMQENFQDGELIDKATDIAERYIKEVTHETRPSNQRTSSR